MSTTIPSFMCTLVRPMRNKQRVHSRLATIRAHNFADKGRSSNHVDSSMKILKDRIEVVRTKERLERRFMPYGWDYGSNYIPKQPEYTKTIALICGTSSLSVIIGASLLYILSVIIHLKL